MDAATGLFRGFAECVGCVMLSVVTAFLGLLFLLIVCVLCPIKIKAEFGKVAQVAYYVMLAVLMLMIWNNVWR